MSHPIYAAGAPRFNHVAMSMPADSLAETGRDDIVKFWSEVFGFEEYPTMTIDRQRLVLGAVHFEQFVFLISDDDPMTCPRLDHFGMSVKSLDDLQGALGRAKAFAATDDRVDIVDYEIDDQDVVKIHSFYVRYLLPMMMEIQYWEFPGQGPES